MAYVWKRDEMMGKYYMEIEEARKQCVKYYAKLRPVSVGTQPKDGFVNYENYDFRKEVNGNMVWAELYYSRELTENEMQDYELIKA